MWGLAQASLTASLGSRRAPRVEGGGAGVMACMDGMDGKHQTRGAPRHQPGAIGFGDRAAPASSITILLVQKLLVTREEVELLSDCLRRTLVEGEPGSISRPSAEGRMSAFGRTARL